MSPDRTEIRNLSSELENLTRQALESHSKAQAKSFLDRILFMEDQIALSPYLRNIFHEFYAQLRPY